MPEADDLDLLGDPTRNAEQQDELENAEVLPLAHAQQSPISGARCINGNLVRPDNAEEEPPSRTSRIWQISRNHSRQTATTTTTTSTSSSSCSCSLNCNQFTESMGTLENTIQGSRRRWTTRWYRRWNRFRNRSSLQFRP